MKKITKYVVACIFVVAGVGLITFGISYGKYNASRMEIRSQISLGEYVLAEQKMSELENTYLYKYVFKRSKTGEYYRVSYDDGLIQLGLREYVKAEKAFSIASESGNTEISGPAGINRIASLWFSGERNPKIIKTILDIAGKVIKSNHNVPASYEKREAQKIAFYIMARQQDMVQKKEGREGDGSGSDGQDKKNAQAEAFKNLMKKKAQEEGR